MATKAYYDWDRAGRHWTPAKPIAELQAWAKRAGVAVLGTIGNDEHLESSNPQDHTPFSYTAWPVALPGYVVTAIDLANVNGLGQKIEDSARRGELPWLKYMNHDGQHLDSRDLDGDGLTWEEYPSSDQHVHLSIRTDWCDRSIGAFHPFGNTPGGDDMELAKFLQEALIAAGYDPGPVDGDPGPRTKAALVAALQAKGQPGRDGKDGLTPTKVRVLLDADVVAAA